MYAVLRTGGKQYRVSANDVIAVEKLPGEAGGFVEFGDILMIGDSKATTLGTPVLEGALVTATILEQGRADKVLVFKKKRRQNYRRMYGHRQDETVLRIDEVLLPGAKPTPRKAKTPPAKAKTPATKAKTPVAEAKTPVAEAKTPAAKAKTPVAEAKAPAAKAKAPAAKAKAPAAKAKAPAAKAKAPAKKKPAAKAPAAKK